MQRRKVFSEIQLKWLKLIFRIIGGHLQKKLSLKSYQHASRITPSKIDL